MTRQGPPARCAQIIRTSPPTVMPLHKCCHRKQFFQLSSFFPSTIVFALNASTGATKIVFLAPQIFSQLTYFFANKLEWYPLLSKKFAMNVTFDNVYTPSIRGSNIYQDFYCIGRPSSILISKRLRIYDIGVCFEENQALGQRQQLRIEKA